MQNTTHEVISPPPQADRRAVPGQEDVHPHQARPEQVAGAPACRPQDPGAEDGAHHRGA